MPSRSAVSIISNSNSKSSTILYFVCIPCIYCTSVQMLINGSIFSFLGFVFLCDISTNDISLPSASFSRLSPLQLWTKIPLPFLYFNVQVETYISCTVEVKCKWTTIWISLLRTNNASRGQGSVLRYFLRSIFPCE